MGLAVWGVSRLLPDIHFNTPSSAIIFVLILTILNLIVKPIFILLTIPITIVTLGLFLIFVNAIMILIADALMSGFHVDGFWWAFVFSIIIAIINWLADSIIYPKETD
jgi:putative membrane protein